MDERMNRPLADVEPDDETELEEIYVVEAVAVEPDESSAELSENEDIVIVRAQIEQTRADMSDTIDAIKEKLSPQNLMQQAKESVREATVGKAQEAMSKAMDATRSAVGTAVDTTKEAIGSAMDSTREVMGNAMDSARPVVSGAVDTVQDVSWTVMDTIRQNPIPAALAATGLVWLALSARNRTVPPGYDQPRYNDLSGYDSFSAGTGEPGWSAGSGQPGWRSMPSMPSAEETSGGMSSMVGQAQEKVGAVVDQAQDKMGAMVDQAQEKAGAMVDQARQKASMVAGQVQDRASQWSNQAQVQAQRAVDTVQQTFWETPMAIGAVALAVGAMIGFAVPSTYPERQMMGEARDQLMGKAQEAVQDVKEKVQTVAQEVMGTAKETAQQAAQDQGLTTQENA
jgi:ElaB/YqjD/DUF883 family membrane-anchored ribosome-binding protein